MSNVTLSGYLTTSTSVAWTSATQKIDSLANNGFTDLSDEIDNSTNKYHLADLDLALGSAAFTGTGAGVEVYIVPTVDGTNYPTWTSGTTDQPSQAHMFASFLPLKAATQAQRVVSSSQAPVRLPNGKFKFGLRSRGGVTLAASGNTLYWRPHTLSL